tara:strand:- start:696 stop:902 length:207 start_codon:yes stop_codon:yes gene_type:complete
MTSEQKQNLDKKILEFNSFREFHSYAYENDIVFDNEEWEEYRDKMKKMLSDNKSNVIEVDFENLIVTV